MVKKSRSCPALIEADGATRLSVGSDDVYRVDTCAVDPALLTTRTTESVGAYKIRMARTSSH